MLIEVFSHIYPIMVHFSIALIVVGFAYDLILLVKKQGQHVIHRKLERIHNSSMGLNIIQPYCVSLI